MKKLSSVVLMLLMVASLCVFVSAATGSVTGELKVNGSSGVVTEITDAQALKDTASNEAIREIAEALGVKDAKECSILATFDLKDEPGEHTFSAPSLANMRVVLLHYVNGAWKVEYDGYADETGTFKVNIKEFSPFAIIGRVGTDKNVSPKTADQPIELMVGALLLSAVTAAFVLKTRKA